MILPAEKRHKKEISSLWNLAFGDSLESVNKYLETLLKFFVVYEEDNIVKGMLSVLPVTCGDKKGGYIYAVATYPDFRGKGICNRLIEHIKDDKKYDFLVLVPQSESLFEFYKKMEFTSVSLLQKKMSYVEKTEHANLKKMTSEEYESARNQCFEDDKIIKWDKNILSFAKSMYNGEFVKIDDGIAFLYKEKNTLFIKELLAENPVETANKIAAEFNAQKVCFSYPDAECQPTYMVYPKDYSGRYFGIYFD